MSEPVKGPGSPVELHTDVPVKMRGRIKTLWIALFLFLPPLFLGVAMWLDDPLYPPDKYLVENWQHVVSASDIPPADSAPWLFAEDTYLINKVVIDGLYTNTLLTGDYPDLEFPQVWQRTEIDLVGEAGQLYGAYFHQPLNNVAVFLEDSHKGQTGPFELPLRYPQNPALFALYQAGSDTTKATLYVRSAHAFGVPTQPSLHLGPHLELEEIRASQFFHRKGITLLMAGIALAGGILALFLWMLRREHSYYGWYALTAILSGLHNYHYTVDDVVVSQHFWLLTNMFFLSNAVFGVIFIHRFLALQRVKTERFLLSASMLLATPMVYWGLVADDNVAYWSNIIWIPWMGILGIYTISQGILTAIRKPEFETLVVALGFTVGALIILRDVVWNLVPEWAGGSVYYIRYHALSVHGVFAFLVIRRFVIATRERDMLTAELTDRVAEKSAELERTYTELRETERMQTLAQERGRIMRDMHDGLGGQLVHAISLAEHSSANSSLSDVLHTALNDLRLIIDSLSPGSDSFQAALASVRHRTATFAEHSGISLRWQIQGLQQAALPPEKSLALTRILQEAITNAVRHSGASNVTVYLVGSADGIAMSVTDDGHGFMLPVDGRGLNNMKIRAKEMGGELLVESSDAGTKVSCTARL